MANYAYRDKERKHIILASKALEEDRHKSFYCPNPLCNSKLFICAVDGSRKAHFRATKSTYKHIANCPYANAQLFLMTINLISQIFLLKMQCKIF